MKSLASISIRGVLGVLGSVASPRLSILIFHRVQAHPDNLFPHEPAAERFDELMRFVARTFNVMTLGQAVADLQHGNLPARSLVITFDDGYADNAEVALPILQRHGLPATFFVASGFLDGGRMWNDSVIECLRTCRRSVVDMDEFGLGQRLLNSISERRVLIDLLLQQLKYKLPAEREECISRLQRLCDVEQLPSDLMMRWQQVRDLHNAGMEIGAHTINHPILRTLLPHEAEYEIGQGREWLQAMIDAPVEVFAFPNGKPGVDYDLCHVELVKKQGFRGAVSTAPGAAQAGDDLFELPRFTPWGRSMPVWAARLVINRLHCRYETTRTISTPDRDEGTTLHGNPRS